MVDEEFKYFFLELKIMKHGFPQTRRTLAEMALRSPRREEVNQLCLFSVWNFPPFRAQRPLVFGMKIHSRVLKRSSKWLEQSSRSIRRCVDLEIVEKLVKTIEAEVIDTKVF